MGKMNQSSRVFKNLAPATLMRYFWHCLGDAFKPVLCGACHNLHMIFRTLLLPRAQILALLEALYVVPANTGKQTKPPNSPRNRLFRID